MARLVFHIDVNSAFLSWEATKRVKNGESDIRLIPSAIGGDRESRRGVILASNLLEPIPTFTVKPSVSRISSFIVLAIATGSG